MRAEREKRAAIYESEGERQAKINIAEGSKEQAIRESEGEKMKRINEAEGRAKEIELVAMATAEGIRKIAEAIQAPGGEKAVNLAGCRTVYQGIRKIGQREQYDNYTIGPQRYRRYGHRCNQPAEVSGQIIRY
jgi:regulator of protease activity HflC (stomatin/prohibitin superfamily)